MENRNLKFRVWHHLDKAMRNHDWLFAAQVRYNSIFNPDRKDIHVMRFTGLLDMNGKEIYEGDKLRILYTDWPSNTDDSVSLEDYKKSISAYGYVAWDEHSTGWIVRVKSKYSVDEDGTVMSSIIHGTHGEREVIGHIYE